MSYEDRIRHERASMSKSFAKLADFLLDSYVEASFMTASELAHALNLDAATVVRFSQFLGYKGFPQLQQDIRLKVKDHLLLSPRQAGVEDSLPGVVDRALRELGRDLEQTRMTFDTEALSTLVEKIGQARRITVLTDAPAQPAAYNLVYFLEQGGFPIYIARSGAVDLARAIHIATPQDLHLAIDITGRSPYLANALTESHQLGIPTAAIVSAASLPSARYADVVLSAQAHPKVISGSVVVSAMIAVLVEALHWRFAGRFAGAEQAINQLYERLQL
ncbi:MAG: MurR/RpiR family transcriptional regulator [Anaerolineales bacterium]|jgi:DNA-binding MurR/RpiR family transcriptional regulator|nr:MurR/RpiR family transcriptional regulator [Anaerolineales bacterium]